MKNSSTLERILADRKRRKLAAAVLLPLCLAAIVLAIVLSLRPALAESFNYGQPPALPPYYAEVPDTPVPVYSYSREDGAFYRVYGWLDGQDPEDAAFYACGADGTLIAPYVPLDQAGEAANARDGAEEAAGPEEQADAPNAQPVQSEEVEIIAVPPAAAEDVGPTLSAEEPPQMRDAGRLESDELPSTDPKDYSNIRVSNVETQGYDWPYFYVNGQPGFCGDNTKDTPDDKPKITNVSLDLTGADNPEMLAKLLYYGFAGPEAISSPDLRWANPAVAPSNASDTVREAYTANAFTIHKALHGKYAGGYSSYSPGKIWNAIEKLPYPNWDLKFVPEEPASSVVTLPDGTQVQRSEAITLQGGPPDNSVKVPVIAPYTIRKDGVAYSTPGTFVEVKVGESFYVEAPLGHTGTYDTGKLLGEKPSKFYVIILTTDDKGDQRIITWKYCKVSVRACVDFPGASPGGPILPETGGTGTGPFAVAGLTMAATLSMLLTGTLIYTTRRKRRLLRMR
ncbi:MAG: LPXTG cell wall anchor domain-containing protein [Oscillospiraceae bacterium]|nr:LPXTG cell wall anchor domain-containing protein [Oscillospiraceae bacterium]